MEPFQKYHLIIFKQLKIPSWHHSIFLELEFMDNLPISMLIKPLIENFNYWPRIWHTARCFFFVQTYLKPELYGNFAWRTHLLLSHLLAWIITLVWLFQWDFHLKVWHLKDIFVKFFILFCSGEFSWWRITCLKCLNFSWFCYGYFLLNMTEN